MTFMHNVVVKNNMLITKQAVNVAISEKKMASRHFIIGVFDLFKRSKMNGNNILP